MKWLVRIGAGVIIALLFFGASRGIGLYRGAFIGSLFVMFFVGIHEGIDMSGFWGDDDDDDGQGPLGPA